jgi:hypothetical protein
MNIRHAIVRGCTTSHALYPDTSFTAMIKLELRDDCVYYTWRAQDAENNFLGMVGRSVSLRGIPQGQDSFEFALAHAV